MINLDGLGRNELATRKDIYEEYIGIEDEIDRSFRKNEILVRAKELGVARIAADNIKAYEKKEKHTRLKEKTKNYAVTGTVTNFSEDATGKGYPPLYCGPWQADEDGVFYSSSEGIGQLASYHPILPVTRLRNIETGEEQITIAFKRDLAWSELTFPKDKVSKASSIVELSKHGIAVTSENAKLLVRYLSDLENWNEDIISLERCTSKLGWRDDDRIFMPYDDGLKFDGIAKFPGLYESINEFGDFSTWLNMARKIRAAKHIAPRVALAASFASVLVKPAKALPFIVDLWGETEGGKTVSLMLAASVWANPAENRYIGDFKTTDVALETRCDLLNSLPLILDDSSKASQRIRDNFESVIYDLCSGKGKSRSNKDLGNDRERYWKNCIICNGERALSSYASQGGAINRVLEIECETILFENPFEVVKAVTENYGFAGKIFVEEVKKMDKEALLHLIDVYQKGLTTAETMQKQTLAMSLVLVADRIATKCIFKDGMSLEVDDVNKFLESRSFVSEGARCYEFINDAILMYRQHFDPQATLTDQWGETVLKEDGTRYVRFYKTAFDRLLRTEGYNGKAFLSWAKAKKLLDTNKDSMTKTIRRKEDGKTVKAVVLQLGVDIQKDSDDDIFI